MIPFRLVLAAALVALAATALGCLDARTTACDGYVCPIGNVCDDAHDGCVVPDQLTTCADAADRTPCSVPGLPDAFCDRGVCLVPVCGNDVEEGLEACDDGNTAGGDGCSAACDSTETCGNVTIDRAQGEECDDGGYRSHDGCSSACALELPIWSEVTRSNRGTEAHEIVYDAARARLVAFGGRGPTGDAQSATLELDGSSWVAVEPIGPVPAGRWGHVLTYDAARRRVVMFGGENSGGTLADTWEYDGLRWRQITIPAGTGPTARSGAAGAFDVLRGVTVLFGGETAAGPTDETWTYDGAWHRAEGAGPPARTGHAMAYDEARHCVVLFGGTGTGGAALEDTWEWLGGWITAPPPSPPAARGAMAWDDAHQRIVLFGGETTASDELWAYDGATWEPIALPPGPAPSARFDAPIAYDPQRAQIVLWGGGIGVTGTSYDDTWMLDADGWHALPTFVGPPKRIFAGLEMDRWRHRFVLFGGDQPPGIRRDDTWTYASGRGWADVTDASKPPAAEAPAQIVFDDARGRMILVRRAGPAFETFAFDGAHFTKLDVGAPPGRKQHMLAYDRARDRVVLFGGDASTTPGGPGSTPDPLGDTWELDGAAWVEIDVDGAPPPRADGAMVYDDTLGKIVLFGGHDAAGARDDTWLYDGARWEEVAAPTRPEPRGSASMVFHAARDRVVLFGGDRFAPGAAAFTDVWEFDGTTWTRADVATGPFPRKTGRIAYDPERKVVMLHGGDPRQDTWELAWRSATPEERCDGGTDDDSDLLVDCADPDCAGTRACACAGPAHEVQCRDGYDEDCDGDVDCEDADCACGGPP